jgi:hypothetical protein
VEATSSAPICPNRLVEFRGSDTQGFRRRSNVAPSRLIHLDTLFSPLRGIALLRLSGRQNFT